MTSLQDSVWGSILRSFFEECLSSYRFHVTLVVGILIMMVLYSGWFHNARQAFGLHKGNEDLVLGAACKNPNCVRCQRYQQVRERATTRLAWILQEMKARNPAMAASLHSRIPSAIRNSNRHVRSCSLQNPSLLMVDELPSQEIVTQLHSMTCHYLQNGSTRELVMRALEQTNSKDLSWTVNDSAQGHWEVLHILNQGTWNPSLVATEKNNCNQTAWENLVVHIKGIPGLMDQCLFGNVMISRIYPETVIEPHCGPTNVRHRLQLVLELPLTPEKRQNSLSLVIGREKQISWTSLDCAFVFDDSYVHSVTYSRGGDENEKKNAESSMLPDTSRTVLIVDLWHPDLSLSERSLLQQLFPPYPATGKKQRTNP
jgi:hypothetical protein